MKLLPTVGSIVYASFVWVLFLFVSHSIYYICWGPPSQFEMGVGNGSNRSMSMTMHDTRSTEKLCLPLTTKTQPLAFFFILRIFHQSNQNFFGII